MWPACALALTLAAAPPSASPDDPADDRAAGSAAAPALTSWDVLGGGVTDGPILATARSGFSRWFDLAAEWPLADRFGLGGFVAVGHGHFVVPGAGGDPGIAAGARLRYRLLRANGWSVGASLGLGARVDLGEGASVLTPISVRGLYALSGRVLVGAGLEVAPRLSGRTSGAAPWSIPVTVSSLSEVHLLPGVAVTLEAGLGPAIASSGVDLALRAQLGLTLRL